ncbi:hypothetical protein [Pelagicoccus mobilis]|uniref:Outer membrane protein beta-barrel domain-containing protein n=1 Tax=Pelagicoccus mobilis TaxID=415221 RepID=A0A934VR71_9BACT|nr:hypothetical protein [Pelagicoccus mobilis]MBK1877313.1 hypothetical protein [Pelagicoccus mobilis]
MKNTSARAPKTPIIVAMAAVFTLGLTSIHASDEEAEKHPDDPTKIITRIGVGYTDRFQVNGSLGLDETKMLNARVSEDLDEWRIGGSWLFDFGIVNFNFSQTDLEEEGATKNNYSLGTFVPLSVFGYEPGGVQIFPMLGYSYNEGEFPHYGDPVGNPNEFVLMNADSHGGYLGAAALKPLGDNYSVTAFGGGSLGSDDYSGYWVGVGAGYKVNDQHSFKAFAIYADDDFGTEEKIGIAYTYEFD